MKRFLLIMITVATLGAAADDFVTEDYRTLTRTASIVPEWGITTDSVKVLRQHGQITPALVTAIQGRPAGEIRAYDRSGGAFARNSEGYLEVVPQSGKVYVVFGEENRVYLQNPVYGTKTGYWVEGTLSDDGKKITVPMGQTLYETENGITLDLCWASTDYTYPPGGDGSTARIVFTVHDQVTEAVYTIDGTSIYLEGTEGNMDAGFPENAVITGLSAVWHDSGLWNSSIDYGTVYTERPYVEPPVIITEQPEGELVDYFVSGESFVPTYDGLMCVSQSGKASIVYGADGKVFLKDPIYGIGGSWVKGTLSDDNTTIIVPMDQFIYWNDDEEIGIMLKKVDVDIAADGLVSYTVDERTTEMTYTINGDTIAINETDGDMNADWPTQMSGLAGIWNNRDLDFSGYMDWNTLYSRIVPAIPADPSLDEADTGFVNAWYDCGNESGGSAFYHVIKPYDIDGNMIDVDRMSYSIYTDDDQIFTFLASDYNGLDEDKTELPCQWISHQLTPQITSFYRTNAEGFKPLFSRRIGIQVYYTVDGIRNASNIVYCGIEPEYAGDGKPENPTAIQWHDCGNETGYSKFTYNINKHTTEGKHMDPSRIYFSIFTDDDQPFTFSANDYSYDLEEDMTLIPYDFTGADIRNNYCYFYRTNADGYDTFFNHQIGVQVYYLCDNGDLNASDIVYLEVFEHEPSVNVKEITAGKTVAGLKYYNMAGREMLKPEGICIAVTTYTDGTIQTTKVVK